MRDPTQEELLVHLLEDMSSFDKEGGPLEKAKKVWDKYPNLFHGFVRNAIQSMSGMLPSLTEEDALKLKMMTVQFATDIVGLLDGIEGTEPQSIAELAFGRAESLGEDKHAG
jgi:hypothetical protein